LSVVSNWPFCALDDGVEKSSLLGYWLGGEFLAQRAGNLDGLDVNV
jgi:hypothetical protein